MNMKAFCIFLLMLLLFACTLPVSAKEDEQGVYDGEILKEFSDLIPEEARDSLPDGLMKELEKGKDADPAVIAGEIDRDFLLVMLKKAGKSMIAPFLSVLCTCLGLCIVASIVRSLHPFGGDASDGMRFLLSVCVCLSVWRIGEDGMELLREALTSVSVFIRAMLPSIAVLYTTGGNFTAGAIEEGFLLILLELIEALCYEGLTPMLQVTFALAVIAHIAGENRLQGLTQTVSRGITVILTFLVTVLTTVLSYQHSIAEGADGLLLRSVKFAASGVIPVIGGTLGEAMGSAMGAVSFLRATVGSVATVVILVILLIPGTYLLGMRLAVSVSAMLSRAIGCQEEGGLYGEIASVFDLAMAILAVCFFSLLFALTLMVRCAVAIG